MLQIVTLSVLWVLCSADDYYHFPFNVTRSTVSGIAAYRSALTLDWLAGEDMRQRELVNAFETEATPMARVQNADCIAYSRPASGKVARLMLELLKNLEGDDGILIPELIKALVKTKLLVETSLLDAEPDLESLVQTPGVMMGEPHTTFPRILAVLWLIASDPMGTKKSGWCAVKKLNQYLMMARPIDIAKQMRALDPIIARARFIVEEFIQHVTPLNMYPETSRMPVRTRKRQKTLRQVIPADNTEDHEKMDLDVGAVPPPRLPPPEFFADHFDQAIPEPNPKRLTSLSVKETACLSLVTFAQFGEYDDIFPNSVTPINDWRPLKHAFTHFFEKQNWSRIAIISDNTPFSAAFEEELVRYFSEKQLVYDVQRCEEISPTSKCNFWRVLRYIKENQAVIVVLNVDACNAAALEEAARAQGLWRQYVMLARDWPFESYEAGAQVFGETFSLTLAPMRSEVHSRMKVSDNDGPHLVSILHGLALIRHAVKVVPKERIDYLYRDIAAVMNNHILFDTYESQAFIRKITPNSSLVVTIITANIHQVISFTEVASAGLSNYDVDCVIMRSNNFRKPCNDLWIILSVVMAVVFVLGMILIMNYYGWKN